MTKRDIQFVLIGVAIVIALVGAYFGVMLPVPEIPQAEGEFGAQAVTERISIDASDDSYIKWGKDLTWYSDNKSTQKAQIEGSAGNADFEGTLDVAGTAALAGKVVFTPGADLVVSTYGITPTASFHVLAPTVWVTPTRILTTSAVDGQFLYMVNGAAFNVKLPDASNDVESTGATLAQYDTAMFVYDSGLRRWVQIATSNN